MSINASDGGSIAGFLRVPRSKRRGGQRLNNLCLDEDRDNLASGKTEWLVVEGSEEFCDFTGVTRDTDPDRLVNGEDVVKNFLATFELMLTSLADVTTEERVMLSEALLEFDDGNQRFDISLVGAVITGVDANTLTKEFLDNGDKRLILGQINILEGFVGGKNAAR